MQCTINSMEKRKIIEHKKREIKYTCFTCFSENATQNRKMWYKSNQSNIQLQVKYRFRSCNELEWLLDFIDSAIVTFLHTSIIKRPQTIIKPGIQRQIINFILVFNYLLLACNKTALPWHVWHAEVTRLLPSSEDCLFVQSINTFSWERKKTTNTMLCRLALIFRMAVRLRVTEMEWCHVVVVLFDARHEIGRDGVCEHATDLISQCRLCLSDSRLYRSGNALSQITRH